MLVKIWFSIFIDIPYKLTVYLSDLIHRIGLLLKMYNSVISTIHIFIHVYNFFLRVLDESFLR